MSILLGREATRAENPLAAYDDWVSLALTIPEISQLSSGPALISLLINELCSPSLALIMPRVFFEIT